MPKVTFLPDEVTVEIRQGLSIFGAALDSEADIESQCGGRGGCALCRVIIREGADNLSPMEWEEINHLGNVYHVTHERLACQARVLGDVTVEIPEPIERAKRQYIPAAVLRNREQMLAARLEAEESEQDATRAVKGRKRRRRRKAGTDTGPQRAVGESSPSATRAAAPDRDDEARANKPARPPRPPRSPRPPGDGEPPGPAPVADGDGPGEPRRRRRRRPRRRGGGEDGTPPRARDDVS
jgi:ferredoxin